MSVPVWAADPGRHGRFMVALCEGIMFDSIAGAGHTAVPTRAEIKQTVQEFLTGMLT